MYGEYLRPSGITWVQGIEGAKAWQMMPGTNIVLMDSENDGIFYIKVCDNIGMCTLRTFKYTEIQNSKPDMSQYITREEFLKEMESLNERIVQQPASESI
jgi:hypothetical protein